MNKKIEALLPVLKKYIDEGVIKCFADDREVKDLSEEQLKKVKEIESIKGVKLKVVAVTDQIAYLPGEATRMQCYLYIEPNLQPWIIEERLIGFMARVVNSGWDIEEDGSVGVVEVDGWLGRCM